jgi:HSP20 family protein
MRSLTPFRSGRNAMTWDSPFEDIFDFMPSNMSREFNAALDVEEREGAYLITVDLPGIKKDEIQINLTDRTLTVSGERTRESKGQGHYYERSYGRFARSLTLPENVKSEAIEAHYEDGVLKLVLPKAEAEKAKAIKIQSGKPSGGLLEKFFGAKETEKNITAEKDVKH